jgi:hypothetical protein
MSTAYFLSNYQVLEYSWPSAQLPPHYTWQEPHAQQRIMVMMYVNDVIMLAPSCCRQPE